jgi:hypothetical protein
MNARLVSVLPGLLALALLGAAPAPSPEKPPPAEKPLDLSLIPSRLKAPVAAPATAPGHPQTKCELCHTPSGWHEAHFPHERTGFPLRDAHAAVSCKACHTQGFDAPLSRQCASCHRDAHAGEFGQRCEGCHESTQWSATQFNADAHRRTNFPLVGRHALLSCQECHVDQRGPVFSRKTVECIGCHQRDYERTRLVSLDHAALGFSTDCRQCHEAWRFQGARFPNHDACFQLSRGEHAGIPCQRCHTSLAALTPTGACATRTAACSGCHEHSCTRTDARHQNVPGYQCKDQKCYECHRFSVKP